MKTFIITMETAIIAFMLGVGWMYDKAVNDEDEREELMFKWEKKDAKKDK